MRTEARVLHRDAVSHQAGLESAQPCALGETWYSIACMGELKKYRRREGKTVVAVRLDLDTAGFTYNKWGGPQRCKRGDWVVKNGDETYTIDAETFARTYRPVSPGVYEKQGVVWVERAEAPGSIATKEGATRYEGGDYLVFNDPERKDGYAVSARGFASLYEPADADR